MASITISCEGTDQKVALETASITLGRGLESDIRLKDIKASRRHCQIVRANGGFQLLDLSSGNGTFVNGIQVKQQMLSPGDKIQIGATTITFHEAAPAPAPAKAASPAKTASAPAVSSKTATAQIPVAATKRITTRAEAVKPTTQAVARAQTQALKKPATQAIPKAEGEKTATGSIKKPSQRAGHTSRSMGKATATQKFQKEARKGKSNPIAVILGGIGVVFLLVVGWILFGSSSGDQNQVIREKFTALMASAAQLEVDHKIDDANKKLNEVLSLVGGMEGYKTQAAEIRQRIKANEDEKKLMAEATGRFAEFEKKFDTMKPENARELSLEGKALMAAVEKVSFEWKPRLKIILEKIEKVRDTEKAIEDRQDFQKMRNEIVEKNNLGSKKGDANYAGALTAWAAYVAQPSADKGKAEGAAKIVQQQAREEYRTIEGRAKRNTDKAAALAEAEKQLPRFAGTDVEADFKKLLEELKAK